jgi:hypothetical protein
MFIPHVHSIIYYGLLKNSNKLEAQSLRRSLQTSTCIFIQWSVPNKVATETRETSGKILVITLKRLRRHYEFWTIY